MMNEQATLTEIQSIRQKMAEAYHIQRQYKTILDVISGERIGYESQLTELEKSIAESKAEVTKLKVCVLALLFYLLSTIFANDLLSANIHEITFTNDRAQLDDVLLFCQSRKSNDRVSCVRIE